MTVGKRIRAIRLRLGMSQVDFAQKINVSKQTLYKYENDLITNIPSDKIEAIANLGNVRPSYLMGWTSPTSDYVYQLQENDPLLIECTHIPEAQIESHIRIQQFLANFFTLNDTGKKKAMEYLEDLVKLYSKDSE